MKTSNANKVISVLMSVAMCPMMVPSAAFAADDDTASGGGSSFSTELIQSSGQAEGADTGAISRTTSATQPETTGKASGTTTTSNENTAPAATAGEEGPAAAATGEDNSGSATGEDSTETGVAEVKGVNYPSLQAAIDVAPERATVKLLANTRENVTISTKNVTLDLNGYTLNGSTGKRKPALTVTSRVFVKDSSEAQTGTIMREDTKENSGISSHYVIDVQGGKNGWLFFQSGNVKNDSGAGGTKGASLVRVGDDKQPGFPHMTITGGTFTQENFIALKCDFGQLVVSGGTINSENSYAIQNWKSTIIRDAQDGTSSPVINGNVSTWTYEGSDSNLEISGGIVNGDVESVTYDAPEGNAAKVKISGGTVNGDLYTLGYSSSTGTSTEINDPAKAAIEVSGGTFKTNPSRYLVESFSATQKADGTYGVEMAYLAKVGETSYYTMEDAINAQTTSGDAITLLRDYTTGSVFASGNNAGRVVDLNGHTWTCTGAGASFAAFQINYPNASITVKNGKVVSSLPIGLITSAKNDLTGEITPYDNSTLTFEGVEATTTATSGIETNGNNTNDAVVLKNSTLNVPNGFGIYFPSSGTLTIDNSTINAKTMGVQVCSGSLSVNAGSKITVSGDPVEKAENDGAIQDGAAISVVNRPGYKGLGQVAITGGTFTAKDANAAIKAYAWNSSTKQESDFDNTAKTVAVFGGTFSSAVASDLCAEDYAPVANGDGTYSVASGVAYVAGKGYDSLADAVAAAKDGDTITLLADCSGDGIAVKGDTFPNGLTIDFAGHSYTVGGKLVGSAGTATNGFQLLKGNTIVMRNGSIYGDASVAGDDTTDWSGAPAIMIQNYSNLTLDGMTVKGGKQTCYTLSNNNGDTVVKDSTIVAGQNKKAGGPWAFDVCRYASYPSVSVTVEGNSVIEGSVDVSGTVSEGQSRQLTITGGKFDKEINVSTQPANIAISGGTFATAVPAEYCAGGFTPTDNGNGTYGVKLDKGAYLLQDYRSGDQADWKYPTQDGKAFAGWYKDAGYKTPCTSSDVEGAAYAKFVDITDLLQYKGGSLRMDVGDPTVSTYLRFGYTMAIPKNTTYVENGWYYKKVTVSSPDDVRFVASNNVLNNDGTITSNLVFKGVKASLYKTTFKEKAFVKYKTADGTTVEAVESAYQSRSVDEVASAILQHPMASQKEKQYAQDIKSV